MVLSVARKKAPGVSPSSGCGGDRFRCAINSRATANFPSTRRIAPLYAAGFFDGGDPS